MSAIIRTEQIRRQLTPWIGARLAEETPIAQRAAEVLAAHVPCRTPLTETARRLEDALFRSLYAALGRSMTAVLDSGRQRRIRMDDLPDLTDDVLGVLLEALEVQAVNYGLLREYAMETGSRSALRVLCTHYAAFQAPEELAVLVRILRDRYPADSRPDWLKLPE